MFTVNRNNIFIAIPIEDVENCVDIEVGYDFSPYVSITMQSRRIEIPLTVTQIDDMIDSLKEIQSRIGEKNA